MSKGLLFWIIMLVWLLFGFYVNWPVNGHGWAIGGTVILWILLALLGWKCFGPPVHE